MTSCGVIYGTFDIAYHAMYPVIIIPLDYAACRPPANMRPIPKTLTRHMTPLTRQYSIPHLTEALLNPLCSAVQSLA
jgi:hypothetical protein